MRYLVVVRHGEYDLRDQLSRGGREEIAALSKKLEPILKGLAILILSSTADRAFQSAEIIGKAFSSEIEQHEILWSDEDHLEDLPGTLELVQSKEDLFDVIVLVTHYEYVKHFPGFFSKNILKESLESHSINKGEAWVLDCIDKTLMHVSQDY